MFKPFQSLYARMVGAMLLYAFLLKMLFKSSMTLKRSSMSERDEAQGDQISPITALQVTYPKFRI
jgi:hypothetical protein